MEDTVPVIVGMMIAGPPGFTLEGLLCAIDTLVAFAPVAMDPPCAFTTDDAVLGAVERCWLAHPTANAARQSATEADRQGFTRMDAPSPSDSDDAHAPWVPLMR